MSSINSVGSVARVVIVSCHQQKESTSKYQTPTLAPAYSQFASRGKTVCCTIASLTSAVFFNKVGQNLPITREVWLWLPDRLGRRNSFTVSQKDRPKPTCLPHLSHHSDFQLAGMGIYSCPLPLHHHSWRLYWRPSAISIFAFRPSFRSIRF